MARFRARIVGRHGNEATRLGDETVIAEVTAQHVGVQVHGVLDAAGDELFRVYATGGRTAGRRAPIYLGRVQLIAGAVVFEPALREGGRE